MDRGFDEEWRRRSTFSPGDAQIFWQKTGWAPGDLRGKVVLDAGCGCGQYTAIAMQHAEQVIAVDLSKTAVEAAGRNVPRADVRVDDLLCLESVADESVDLAFALGSLNHTGDTRKAFSEVARKIKVGGQFAVWVYCRPVSHHLLPVLEMLHEITRAVPPETLYDIFEQYAPAVRDVYGGVFGELQQIVRVSNLPDDAECVAATFDWHCPQHRDWHTAEEVTTWFETAGFRVDLVGEFPVCVRGTKISGKPRARRGKPRVLLVSDVRGWAFDQFAHDLENSLERRFNFEHGYVWEWQQEGKPAPDMRNFDVVFTQYHRWGIEDLLPWDRTVGALRARWLRPEIKGPPTAAEIRMVNSYVAFQVVTQANLVELRGRCPGVVYLTNPINVGRFSDPMPKRDVVIGSWNGNARHSNKLNEDVKGLYSVIVPACWKTGLRLEYAEYTENRVASQDMPEFYRRGNLALCASLYEGASSSVMEAMAAGQAVIATDVGNHREMMESELAEYGDTGIVLVERSVTAFVEQMDKLMADPQRVHEMGEINRQEIWRAWSWDVWADRFAEFLLTPLGGRR